MLESAPAEVNSERLLLRWPQHCDAAAIQRQANNPRVALMTANIPFPYKLSDATDWLARLAGLRTTSTTLAYAVLTQSNTQLIGISSLMQIADGEAELGYWIGEEFWGQGYCSEAGRAILDVAFSVLNLRGVRAHHIAENPASGRVLEKIGFGSLDTEERLFRGQRVPCRTYYLARTNQPTDV
jgi:[ribosomal protein S5]-alanine N-acetyltransferase